MHHRDRRRRMGPVGRHIRSSLRRRIFWWFVATIFVTSGAIGVTMGAINQASGTSWWRDYERLQTYVSMELSRSWDDPAARDQKLAEAAKAFDVDTDLLAPDGSVITRIGTGCGHAQFKAPV